MNVGSGIDRKVWYLTVADSCREQASSIDYGPPENNMTNSVRPAHTVLDRLVVLVDEPHVSAARSRGLPAIAVADDRVDPRCAQFLAGRFVTVLMDAAPARRRAAKRIAAYLDHIAAATVVADFAPHRDDGYGLSDWLADHPNLSDVALLHLMAPNRSA
jgi:hypothetical protein